MAFGGDIRAGRAFVEVFLENRKLLRGLANTQRKLRNFGTSVTALGRQMTFASAGMLLPIAASTKLFADFESKMALVATLLEEPEKHIENFTKAIDRLSISSGKSTDDLADGLFDIISALVSADDAMDTLTASTRLSVAGNADAKETTAALLTLMETYGGSLRDAADGADLLFTIQRRGRTTIGELAPEIGRILSTTKAAGLSLEDMGASMALLTRATGQTTVATTALNAIVSAFLKPAAEGAELWAEKFGTSFDFATLQAEGMLGVLEKLSQLDPGKIAKIFPNVRALRGLFPAIEKMGGFEEDAKAMADRAGSVDKAYKIMAATVTHAYDQLISGAKSASRAVGAALGGMFTGWAAQATTAFAIVGDFISANPELVVTFTKVAIALGAVGAAFLAVGVTATVLSTLVGGIAAALPILGAVIGAIVSPVGLFVAAIIGLATTGVLQRWIKEAISGLKSLGVLFSPIASGIRFIADAVTFARNAFQTLTKDFGLMWDAVGKAIGAGNIESAVEVMTATMRLSWLRMITWLEETWEGFKIFWLDLTNSLSKTLIDALATMREAWSGLLGEMAKAWEKWKLSTFEEGLADIIAPIVATLTGESTEDIRRTLKEDFERGRKRLPQTFADIDKETAEDLAAIEEDRVIGQEELAKNRERQVPLAGERIAAAQKALAAAIVVRDKAAEDANKSPVTEPGGDGKKGVPGIAPPVLAGIGGAIRGTFSAAEAAGFGGAGSAAERTAKAVEMISKQAQREADRVEVFRKRMTKWAERISLEAGQ